MDDFRRNTFAASAMETIEELPSLSSRTATPRSSGCDSAVSAGGGWVTTLDDVIAAEYEVTTRTREIIERYAAATDPTGRRTSSASPSTSRGPEVDDDDVNLTDSDFYDTDIELDEDILKNVRIEDESPGAESERRYRSTCDKHDLAPLTAVLRGLPDIKVDVRHRCLGDGDAHALSHALRKNSTVTRLELGGNNIGALGTLYLKTVLTLNSNITYLDLSDNGLGRQSTTTVAIADVLRSNTGLETLILAGNNLRDQEAIYLAAGILANSRLVRLDLSHNMIGETGAIHLGRAFAINNGIDVLDLSWNNIRQKGAVALCRGLQENGYVSKLNVSWNGFGYEGSLAVGELLKKNETLVELDLSANRINWQAVGFIAAALIRNKSLDTLKLDNNPLTTTGCMDLIEAVANPTCALVHLSLKSIPVIGDFELMMMMIRQLRPEFTCQHGGVVGSHDVIGQRLDKRVTPIQKVINFMKEREYRPTELFRMLDKNVSNKLSHDEMAQRLRKVGIQLPSHEIEELLEFINASSATDTSTNVDFQAMARGVKGQKNLERQEKIRERERAEAIKSYHLNILTAAELASTGADPAALLPDTDDVYAEMRNGKTPNASRSNVMSMSTALGAKAKQFGKAIPAKKARKKSKKKAKKRKHVDTTDYDAIGAM